MPTIMSVPPPRPKPQRRYKLRRFSLRCKLRGHVEASVSVRTGDERWAIHLAHCLRCGRVLDASASHAWKQRNK